MPNISDIEKQVVNFHIATNKIKAIKSKTEFALEVRKQSKIILEEVLEMLCGTGYSIEKHTENGVTTIKLTETGICDFNEILDGAGDILYTSLRLPSLFNTVGIPLIEATMDVCSNNNLKYTYDFEAAQRTAQYQADKDVDCYVDTATLFGKKVYSVKTVENDKVLKYENFPKVDLSSYLSIFNRMEM